jgi:hypothetical protein
VSEDRQKSALIFCMAQASHGRPAGAGIALIVVEGAEKSIAGRSDGTVTPGPLESPEGPAGASIEPGGYYHHGDRSTCSAGSAIVSDVGRVTLRALCSGPCWGSPDRVLRDFAAVFVGPKCSVHVAGLRGASGGSGDHSSSRTGVPPSIGARRTWWVSLIRGKIPVHLS